MNTDNYSSYKNRTLVNNMSISLENDCWRFIDSKGSASLDETIESTCELDDMISSLAFSPDGKYLAVGDFGGRVIVFKHRENKKQIDGQYKSLLGLTSHTAEFDKLRSIVVAPTIDHLLWLNHNCNSHIFISSNSSTIKLWKIKEGYRRKKSKRPLRMSTIKSIDDIKFPDFKRRHDYSPTLICQYPSLYGSPINSISVSYDDQYFLVSDSTSIGMFSIERNESRYEIFRLEDLNDDNNELISTMTFLPYNSSLFFYGTSHGNVNVCDLRIKSYCEKSLYAYSNIFASKDVYYSSYSEIHCIRVLNDTQMLTRDFMSLCHWDLRMTQRPIEVFNINHPVRYNLWELIESDNIFHRFQIATSPDAKYFITGSYNNQFHLFEKDQSGCIIIPYTKNLDINQNLSKNKAYTSFNGIVNSYIYNDSSNYILNNILPIQSDNFHDLESPCPKRKLGSGCITEKSFDLLDRRIKSFDFAYTHKRYNFETGTINDQHILKYVKDRHHNTSKQKNNESDILCDVSRRKLNINDEKIMPIKNTHVNTDYNQVSDKCYYPVSFDPVTEGPRIKPSSRNKISHLAWHPFKNFFVVATQFNLYFYDHSPKIIPSTSSKSDSSNFTFTS